jgi:hypothetical protein
MRVFEEVKVAGCDVSFFLGGYLVEVDLVRVDLIEDLRGPNVSFTLQLGLGAVYWRGGVKPRLCLVDLIIVVLTSSCTAIAFACCPAAVYISASRLLISSVVLSNGPQTLLKL